MRTNLYGVDLNLLVALEALLAEQSVTRAGEQLGITQSAMSNTLARLRRLFDDEILVRVGREWKLTPRAYALQEPLARMLAIAREEVLSPTPFDPASSERHFRIATANAAAVVLLAPLVAQLSREAPGLVIQIVPVGQPGNELLERADIDMMLVPDLYGITHPNRRLLSLEWACVVDRDHPFQGERFDPESFARYPHITYEHDGIATNAQATLVAHGLAGPARVVVDDFVVIPFLLRGSHLVSLVQDALAEQVLEGQGLRRIEPPIPLPGVRIHMYWHARNQRDPGHRWLRNRIVAVSRGIRQ